MAKTALREFYEERLICYPKEGNVRNAEMEKFLSAYEETAPKDREDEEDTFDCEEGMKRLTFLRYGEGVVKQLRNAQNAIGIAAEDMDGIYARIEALIELIEDESGIEPDYGTNSPESVKRMRKWRRTLIGNKEECTW